MNEDSADGAGPQLPAGAKFHEKIASAWSKGYASGSFRKRLSCFLPILDRSVVPKQAWLDLGCGSGVLTKELLERGAEVVAVDGSPGMLEAARAFVGNDRRAAVTWLRGNVQSLAGLADGSFDGVLCSSVIEYVDDPDALLREVARVLRNRGTFIVSVPPRFSAVRTIQKIVRRTGQAIGKDLFPYLEVSRFEARPGMLDEWLNGAGFGLDRSTRFDPVFPSVLQGLFRPSLMILECHKTKVA